ncbi:hypothetical protein [Suttonella ornithocola]|uniref:Uncharacterized protein involved in outer membrane biogenesis n=1 Tax=Suttonella ornithocola TaxID=279832 RepID=A0A380MSA0_9GAMM|nr:hypothetical protein [Suttonella ornithocola]SUO95435.1 Uncharacterized protein involved in outer membrane biogenesis [Suttonella ornithocola]
MKQTFLFLIILFLCAWTVEIEVEQAKIGQQQLHNLAIQAKSLDLKSFSLQGEAQRFIASGHTYQPVHFEGKAVREGADLSIKKLIVTAFYNKNPLYLNLSATTLKDFFQQTLQTPENLELSLSGKTPLLKIRWQNQQKMLTLAQKQLTAKQLRAILSFIGIYIDETLTGTLIPNLKIYYANHGWQLTGDILLENGSWHSTDQMQAAEKLNVHLGLSLEQTENGWTGRIKGELEQGEIFINPLYLNFSEAPIQFSAELAENNEKLTIQNLRAQSPNTLAHLDLTYHFNQKSVDTITLYQLSGEANTLYQRYLKAYLAETLLEDATLTGSLFISGHWEKDQGITHPNIVLNHIDITDKQDRFALKGLDGQIGESGLSEIRIAPSRWRKLPIGAAKLSFRFHNGQPQLTAPFRLPILGGALVISDLKALPKARYQLKMQIEPIDLEALTNALDLPPFQGNISGSFPEVTFTNEGLYLGQPVRIHAFNGQIMVNDLVIHQLFAPIPLLYFSIALEHIDLTQLTHAFNIAEIQGNLSGEINDVALANWQPQQFDAYLYTDLQNPGTRKISHKAVQYLTQAGGASVAIREFVRLLNKFPYQKLGIRAQLQGHKLTLDGIETAPDGGFYIVKGKGIPHLDIIGHQRETDYRELINRLKTAINSDGPVIQ